MKYLNKAVALVAIVGIFGASAPLASAMTPTADILPVQNTVRLHISWGNVYGEVHTSTKTNFDGFVTVNNKSGKVTLVETVGFEHHDAYRDKVTSKANPVIWRSWIHKLSDGVVVDVKTQRNDKVTISTMQGEMTIPMRTLINATDIIELSLGDGREIVVKAEEITPTMRPFHIVIGWGGPVSQLASTLRDLKPVGGVYSDAMREAVASTVLTKSKARVRPYTPVVDFSGAVAVSGGASSKLVTPFWFEKSDKITRDDNNYTSWTSKIKGHFDGVILKANFDEKGNVYDDKISYKSEAGGVGFGKDMKLMELYKKGIVRDTITIDGRTYTMVAVAVRKPICKTFFSKFVETCPSITAAKPLPMVKPFLKPMLKPIFAKPSLVAKPAYTHAKPAVINFASARAQLKELQRLVKSLQMQAKSIK